MARQNGESDFRCCRGNSSGQRVDVFRAPAEKLLQLLLLGYPLLCSQRRFFVLFFFYPSYIVSKKVGRMAEQLEKLQVEMECWGEVAGTLL